jgi:hypothetical protein
MHDKAMARLKTKVHVNPSQTHPETANCMLTSPSEKYKVCTVDAANASFQTAFTRGRTFHS